ncbi:MAG: hemerythrin domain-containing protein, partial [Gammaproteobacteria bacterium]
EFIMDIYQYLKRDHKKVKNLFSEIISEKRNKKRKNLLDEVIEELTLHMESERKTFYKELKKQSESKEEAQHGDKEHGYIKKAIAKLTELPAESTEWFVQLGELKSIVEHHIKEEESTMFKAAKKILSKEMASDLVDKMEAEKQKIQEKAE